MFAAGEAQLRTELPAYDTGGWSRYSLQRDADVQYHTVARDFLRNLCTRLTEDVASAPAPAVASTPAGGTPVPAPTGGAVPAPVPGPVPAVDPAPYCGAAQRWTAYLTRPATLALVSKKVRGGKPASVKLSVSKPAYVTLRLRRGGRTLVVLGGRLGSGVRTLRWPRPPRRGGRVSVVLRAQDLTGNAGTGEGTLRVLKARGRKR
jgi:hypothetical protein